jgi:DNA transformation protein and related proteins
MNINEPVKNLGPVSGGWLKTIGVETRADLEKMGIEAAFEGLVLQGFNVNALMLYAMEGALTDTNWNEVPDKRKAELRKIASEIKKRIRN